MRTDPSFMATISSTYLVWGFTINLSGISYKNTNLSNFSAIIFMAESLELKICLPFSSLFGI